MKKIIAVLLVLCISAGLCSCREGNTAEYEVSKPYVTADESLPGKSRTVWDCVYFGTYPTAEVINGEFTAVDEYAVREGDIIEDKSLYERLLQAEWENDETAVDGDKYRRLKGDAQKNRTQHYVWNGEYHYFKYMPVKWRVMEVKDDIITLMCDRQIDCVPYNTSAENVCWENCTLRSFLNGYSGESNVENTDFSKKSQDSFYNTAFSEKEKSVIIKDTVKNPNNYYFGTSCGNDTKDCVFILDEEEVFDAGKSAVCSGFASSDGTDDTARRFQPTMYAMARGAWYSPSESTLGNGFWLLRTSGYTPSNVTYICDLGAVYNRGTYVTVKDAGILPVIRVDKEKAVMEYAGKVSSDEIFKKTESENTESFSQISEKVNTYETADLKISEPTVVKNQFYSSGFMSSWDCIYFGTYPTAEIVKEEFSAVEEYAVEDDVIIDKELYESLLNAEWENDETLINGDKYRRMKGTGNTPQHYRWDSEYHYFKYMPVKWRVTEINGNEAVLIADKILDCEKYNKNSAEVQWENCTLRSFLNGYSGESNIENADFSKKSQDSFYNTAFSETEKLCIINSEVPNPDNSYYHTDCGNVTRDKVFLLSAEEVFSTASASRHGFYAGTGVDDPAKRFKATLYAKAKGAWYSPVENYRGNSFWYMCTNGYSLSNVTYICDFGYIYNRGTDVSCDDGGILPVIKIDLSKTNISYAGRVSSEQ